MLIADSHAICAYLSEKYGKTDKLYPKDLVKRALVDSRLHFDSGHLFARLRFMYEPVLFRKSPEIPEDRKQYIRTAFDILARFLEKTPFVCGEEMTIADHCLAATTVSLIDIIPLDATKHSKITEWIDRMSKLPYFEELNAAGGRELQAAVRAMLQKNAEGQ